MISTRIYTPSIRTSNFFSFSSQRTSVTFYIQLSGVSTSLPASWSSCIYASTSRRKLERAVEFGNIHGRDRSRCHRNRRISDKRVSRRALRRPK